MLKNKQQHLNLLTLWHSSKPIVVLLGLAAFLTGCALAPLSTHTTARSQEQGTWQTSAGITYPANTYVRQSYGATDNLDIGVELETGFNSVGGLWGKYSLINQEEGFSFALIGAGGGALGSNSDAQAFYTYGGGIVSYRFDQVEPYFIGRLNYVHINGTVEIDEFDDEFNFTANTTYGGLTAGSNFWFNENIGMTANATVLLVEGKTSNPLFNFGIVARY